MSTATRQVPLEASERPPFPKALSYAGAVWIVYGAITLFGVLTLFAFVAFSAVPFPTGEALTQVLLSLAAGVGLLYIGMQTVRGTTSDTAGNGIGSIIWGAILLYGTFNSGDEILQISEDIALVAFVFGGVYGAMMIGAGLISLAVRENYRAWRGTSAAADVDAKTSFLDSQFIRMSPIGLCLLPLCFPPIAILLGLVGFFMGRHPVARKRATVMAVVATIWPVAVIVWFLGT